MFSVPEAGVRLSHQGLSYEYRTGGRQHFS